MKNLDDLIKLQRCFNEPIIVQILISSEGKLFILDAITKRAKEYGIDIDDNEEQTQASIKHIKKIPDRNNQIESYFG
jgi:hypothetical protein